MTTSTTTNMSSSSMNSFLKKTRHGKRLLIFLLVSSIITTSSILVNNRENSLKTINNKVNTERSVLSWSLTHSWLVRGSVTVDSGDTEKGRSSSSSSSRHILQYDTDTEVNESTGTPADPITTSIDTVHDGKPVQTGSNGSTQHCLHPTIDEFPSDLFTLSQQRHGFVLFHFIMAIYMFVALAIVCDDYFVSSLDTICERLGLSKDVAGATFMAAGSSAPELFTSVIGVFITKGDVGVGTIVGSAVFNILFVIGICALFAGHIVPLTWWPLFRDSSFYSFSVIILVVVIYDGLVFWYEAMSMLILYTFYIGLMRFNPVIVRFMQRRKCKQQQQQQQQLQQRQVTSDTENQIQANSLLLQPCTVKGNDTMSDPTSNSVLMVDEVISNASPKLGFPDAGLRMMMTSHFAPRSRMRAATRMLINEKIKMMNDPSSYSDVIVTKQEQSTTASENGNFDSYREALKIETSPVVESGPMTIPTGKCALFRWLLVLPLTLVMFFTIPDCRKQRWKSWFMLTFFNSVIWIALFSYCLVWMVSVIGFILEIPDTIMGITLLAAGTSVPDAMASLLVARQGLGDMAVSNSIGSNVFDILLGLALPWFIKTTITSPGSTIRINSKGLLYSTIMLFITVTIAILCIHFNKWVLSRRLGAIYIVAYCVYLTFSTLIEFNVFGRVNIPPCPR